MKGHGMKRSLIIPSISVGILLLFGVFVVAQGETNENFAEGSKLLKGGIANFWDGADFFAKIDKKESALLERALEDDDPVVRAAAAYGLMRIYQGDASPDARAYQRSSEDVLWDIVKDRKASLELREIAVNVIGGYGAKANADKLFKFGEEAPEPELAMAAIYRAYYLTNVMKGRDVIKERLDSKRVDLRAKATFYLADMGDTSPEVKASLKELAKEPSFRGMVAQKLVEHEEMIAYIEKKATGGADRQRIAILEGELEKALKKAEEAIEIAKEPSERKSQTSG